MLDAYRAGGGRAFNYNALMPAGGAYSDYSAQQASEAEQAGYTRVTLPDGSIAYMTPNGLLNVESGLTNEGYTRNVYSPEGQIASSEYISTPNLSATRSLGRAALTLGTAALGANVAGGLMGQGPLAGALSGGAAGAGAAVPEAVAGTGGATAPAAVAPAAVAPAAAAGGGGGGASSGLTWLAPMASIVGPAIAGAASVQAARTQAGAVQQAAQTQQDTLNRQIELNEPWRQAGINALQRMQSGDIGLTQDPSYAFRFSEGLRALERLRAAGGKLYSGGTARAATEFGQNLASTEYGNAWNRLAQLAGVGQTATGAQTSAVGTYGARAGDLATSAGAARASGYVGPANVLTQALQDQQRQNQFNQLLTMYGPRQQQAPAAAPAPAMAPEQQEDMYSPFRVPRYT